MLIIFISVLINTVTVRITIIRQLDFHTELSIIFIVDIRILFILYNRSFPLPLGSTRLPVTRLTKNRGLERLSFARSLYLSPFCINYYRVVTLPLGVSGLYVF